MYLVSKCAIMLVLVVFGTMLSVVVEARFPKTRVVGLPVCSGNSNKEYNDNLRHLLDFFVDETKNTYRKPGADYVYDHSYPNRDISGSVNGVATCNKELAPLDCWSCLRTTKDIINSRCHRAISGRVTLQDCSISFKNVIA
ncbi:unnamed protein product [Linum tenue]|uniref:Gnk2-homologous domain-containing protein n=3 Tax=Linum tenue TaxID=586396 RepID=A0AAV0HJQ9_9ROSI|nr:unnamed protein product [Linum tenue]